MNSLVAMEKPMAEVRLKSVEKEYEKWLKGGSWYQP